MATMSDKAGETHAGPDLPSAKDMRDIIEEKKRDKAATEEKLRHAAEEEKKHQQALFLQRKLTPELISQIMARVRAAAETGATEILLGQFPSEWCTDGGRRIDMREDGWPDTLPGVAREFYEFWERNLKPKGFQLRAEIITFPGGKLGDVGGFLSWKG